MLINKENFKECLSKFATGITVITFGNDDKKNGITINSFSSVSLSPFLVSFCINRLSSIYQEFIKRNHFCVNILNKNQVDLCNIFAKHKSLVWDNIPHFLSPKNKDPVLNDVTAYIECNLFNIIEAGDHSIILCEVVNCEILNDIPGLIYQNRSFGSLLL